MNFGMGTFQTRNGAIAKVVQIRMMKGEWALRGCINHEGASYVHCWRLSGVSGLSPDHDIVARVEE